MSARLFFGKVPPAPLFLSLSGGGSGTVINSPPSNTPLTTLVTTFPDTTATVIGGVPPYTYSWARISGSTAVTATQPSGATTQFSGTVPFGTTSATFRLTVNDSAGGVATADWPVTLTYESGF